MAEVIYTIKDRQTGEILCQGARQKCAEYVGCKDSYLGELAKKDPNYKINTKYSKYKVERQFEGEYRCGGARLKDVICCDCGLLMKDASATRKRCPDCAYKYNLEQSRNNMRKVRNIVEIGTYNYKNPNQKYCEGCVYYFGEYQINKCCNYIFIEGKRRPCQPGKDCTVEIMRSEGNV